MFTSSGSMSSLSSSSSSFSDRFLFCSSVSFFSPLNRNCYWVWKWMVLHRGCQKVLNDNIGLVFIRPRLMSLCLVGGVMVLVLVVRLQMNIWSLLSRGRRSRTAREALTLLRISTRPLMKQKKWNKCISVEIYIKSTRCKLQIKIQQVHKLCNIMKFRKILTDHLPRSSS